MKKGKRPIYQINIVYATSLSLLENGHAKGALVAVPMDKERNWPSAAKALSTDGRGYVRLGVLRYEYFVKKVLTADDCVPKYWDTEEQARADGYTTEHRVDRKPPTARRGIRLFCRARIRGLGVRVCQFEVAGVQYNDLARAWRTASLNPAFSGLLATWRVRAVKDRDDHRREFFRLDLVVDGTDRGLR